MRTVGIASASFQNQHGIATRVHCVCDDGTCWILEGGTWHQIVGIPGTINADFIPETQPREQS